MFKLAEVQDEMTPSLHVCRRRLRAKFRRGGWGLNIGLVIPETARRRAWS
jgi:hypothetical protein